MKFRLKTAWSMVLLLLCLFLAACGSPKELTVTYLDVGAADAIIVQCDGEAMLIDAGENQDGADVVTAIQSKGITQLEYVIGTHPHGDHIGGLDDVLLATNGEPDKYQFEIDNIIMPKVSHTSETYTDLLTAIAQRSLTITAPVVGRQYELGGADFTILGPTLIDEENLNNSSVVLRLTYGDTSFLFAGDAEEEEEIQIMGTGQELQSQVLKVGHHGSETSSSQEWLEKVQPETGIISVGKENSHPDQIILDHLSNIGAEIYSTKANDTITVTSDGKVVQVQPSREGETVAGAPVQQEVEGNYIGNRNSKKFHALTCSSLPKEANREYFGSREKAVNAGYMPCLRCNP